MNPPEVDSKGAVVCIGGVCRTRQAWAEVFAKQQGSAAPIPAQGPRKSSASLIDEDDAAALEKRGAVGRRQSSLVRVGGGSDGLLKPTGYKVVDMTDTKEKLLRFGQQSMVPSAALKSRKSAPASVIDQQLGSGGTGSTTDTMVSTEPKKEGRSSLGSGILKNPSQAHVPRPSDSSVDTTPVSPRSRAIMRTNERRATKVDFIAPRTAGHRGFATVDTDPLTTNMLGRDGRFGIGGIIMSKEDWERTGTHADTLQCEGPPRNSNTSLSDDVMERVRILELENNAVEQSLEGIDSLVDMCRLQEKELTELRAELASTTREKKVLEKENKVLKSQLRRDDESKRNYEVLLDDLRTLEGVSVMLRMQVDETRRMLPPDSMGGDLKTPVLSSLALAGLNSLLVDTRSTLMALTNQLEESSKGKKGKKAKKGDKAEISTEGTGRPDDTRMKVTVLQSPQHGPVLQVPLNDKAEEELSHFHFDEYAEDDDSTGRMSQGEAIPSGKKNIFKHAVGVVAHPVNTARSTTKQVKSTLNNTTGKLKDSMGKTAINVKNTCTSARQATSRTGRSPSPVPQDSSDL